MTNISSDLSVKNFQRMVAGGKNYLPQKIAKELKFVGISFSAGSRLSKQQAMKALAHLKEKGMLPRYKQPEKIYQQTAIKQFEEDLAAEEAEKQKHIRANIMIDVAEELAAEEEGKDLIKYDPRGALGKPRVLDEIETSQRRRNLSIRKELEKRKRATETKGGKPQKPELLDLPDMPIDFGH